MIFIGGPRGGGGDYVRARTSYEREARRGEVPYGRGPALQLSGVLMLSRAIAVF